jgi:hypothetical protein
MIMNQHDGTLVFHDELARRQAANCFFLLFGYGTRLWQKEAHYFSLSVGNWSYANRTFHQLKPLLLQLLLSSP